MKLDFGLCEYYLRMPATHWERAQSALDFICTDSVSSSLFKQIQQAFFDYKNPQIAASECQCLYEYMNTFAPQYQNSVFSAVFAASLPQLVNNLRTECKDENILQDTLLDYSIWAKEYEAETEEIGIGNYQWISFLFSQKIYRLGRLQYERTVFENPFYVFRERNMGKYYVIPCGGLKVFSDGKNSFPLQTSRKVQFITELTREGDTLYGHIVDTDTASILPKRKRLNLKSLELLLAPGMPVLNIHIPRSGSLKEELVDISLKQAAEFFRDRGFPVKLAVCESWLLDPAIPIYAANSGNICSFQGRFGKYPLRTACSDAKQRIYGKENENTPVQELPTETNLQRGLKNYLLQGGRVLDTGGILLLE